MTHQEAAAAPNVITGKVFLSDIEVYVLIELALPIRLYHLLLHHVYIKSQNHWVTS